MIMNYLRNLFKLGVGAVGAVMLFAGCQSQPEFIDPPNMPRAYRGSVDTFNKGDLVQITFVAPGSEKAFQPHEERVKEDGTITPPDVGSVKAVGKTSGELREELQAKYNKLYVGVTVTVKAGERYYHVDGEVRQAGPKPYLGDTDLIKAIAAAGGFTDFARKSKIRIFHANGRSEIVDYDRAIEDAGYNVAVYPGDKIVVPRRIF